MADIPENKCKMSAITDPHKRLAAYKEEYDRLEWTERRGHVRALESRIVMSKKEKVAREAMIAWIEEEMALLDDQIAALEKQLSEASQTNNAS